MLKRSFAIQWRHIIQKRHSVFDTIGWDGIALLLNIVLLSLNLRQHFRYREPSEHYEPVQAQDVQLLTLQEVEQVNGKSLPEKEISESEDHTIADPDSENKKKTVVQFTPSKLSANSSIPISKNHEPVRRGTILSATKIPALLITDNTKDQQDATGAPCAIFGPLTLNRLQQLQKLWKKEGHTSDLTEVTTQPLHHYSVVFPTLLSSVAENKRAALDHAGFKLHEVWDQGRSHSLIVMGSFDVAAAANSLLQRLHQKGFRETYLMVRTSPTVYWLQKNELVQEWLSQTSIARAEGEHWKAISCSAPAKASTQTSLNAHSADNVEADSAETKNNAED